MRRWLPLALAIAAGCSDAPGRGPITSSEARDECTKSCEYEVDCLAEDQQVCVDDCVTEVVGWARHDAIATLSSCRAGLTCDEDTSSCLEKVKPVDFHRKFQDACRAGLDGCASIDIDVDCAIEYSPDSDDIGYFRFMSEPVIDELIGCFDGADCQARLDCMEAVYAERGIQL